MIKKKLKLLTKNKPGLTSESKNIYMPKLMLIPSYAQS